MQIFSNDSLFVVNCQRPTTVCLLPALNSIVIKNTRMWSAQRKHTSSICHGKLQRPLTMKHSTYYYQGDIHRTKAHAFYIATCYFSAFNEIFLKDFFFFLQKSCNILTKSFICIIPRVQFRKSCWEVKNIIWIQCKVYFFCWNHYWSCLP